MDDGSKNIINIVFLSSIYAHECRQRAGGGMNDGIRYNAEMI